jgi:hypothetical protein
MSRAELQEENVRRIYPKLLEVLEGETPADAGIALCTALTILAWREDYSLDSILWMTRDSIINGWRALEWGILTEGSEKDEQTEAQKAVNDGGTAD